MTYPPQRHTRRALRHPPRQEIIQRNGPVPVSIQLQRRVLQPISSSCTFALVTFFPFLAFAVHRLVHQGRSHRHVLQLLQQRGQLVQLHPVGMVHVELSKPFRGRSAQSVETMATSLNQFQCGCRWKQKTWGEMEHRERGQDQSNMKHET